MREWNHIISHPITMTIAADARLCPAIEFADQVWELNIGSSEPPALSLQTTFGLKARSCRIFPRFAYDRQIINNPLEFYSPITIHKYLPNYINLSFKPFQWFNVMIEYWVPDAQSIACRTKIINISREKRHLLIEWAEVLIPTEDGHRMSPTETNLVTILAGKTADISPVLFLSGGAQPGKSPYPSLELSYQIHPHHEQETTWVHSALSSTGSSFVYANKIIAKDWDAQTAPIFRVNSRRVEIETGDDELNSAFYLSQTIADQLFIHTSRPENNLLFLNQRKPDSSFSTGSAGVEPSFSMIRQSTLKTFYMMNFVLPASPENFKAIVDSQISIQAHQLDTDNLTKQQIFQIPIFDTPLLSYFAWEYYRYTHNKDYLSAVYPNLLSIFLNWFLPAHDRDADAIPEWDQLVQTGFEDNPLFSFAGEKSLGLDITTVESPDLCSYLYNECQVLIMIANEIKSPESIPQLISIAANLKSAVESLWNDQETCYQYRDRDTHTFSKSQILGKRNGSGYIAIDIELDQPVRLVIQVKSGQETTRAIQVYIQGTTANGAHRVEHILPNDIHWHINHGYSTSKYPFKKIEQIEVTGLSPLDEIVVQTAGYSDINLTQFLPLWAGIPSDDKAQVMANLAIMNKKKFLSSYGVRTCISPEGASDQPDDLSTVRPEWVNLISRGLVRYGQQKKAAEIFSRLCGAVIASLQNGMIFHQNYHSESGKPLGAENTLYSLLPIGLFLEILGIKIISPFKVEIRNGNPFPWPVTIKYCGLTVVHQSEKTMLIFSDGQSITIDNQQTVSINLEESVVPSVS